MNILLHVPNELGKPEKKKGFAPPFSWLDIPWIRTLGFSKGLPVTEISRPIQLSVQPRDAPLNAESNPALAHV